MGQPSIVVVGSSNTDMIIRLDRLPRAGETVLGGEFMTAAGGKGANQAVAAARAGGKVSFIARLGGDRLGDQALAIFVKDGINVKHVSRDRRAASGAALIFVAAHGENSIAVAAGANDRLSPQHVRRARLVIARAQVLLMQLETPLPTIEAAARLAVSNGTRVILNPAPARQLPDRLLRRVSILTPNELEAESLTGIRIKGYTDAARAAQRLRQRGVETVIVTLGARGALIADGQSAELVRSFKVHAVDTTAAGDVFNGALAAALSQGQRLRDAVRFANAAAALSVTCMRAQPSAPRRLAIERFMKSHSKPAAGR
jgi:ribokinase